MNQEKIILNENGVLVSTTRFVAPQATYAMASVSSLRTSVETHALEAIFIAFFALFPTAIGFGVIASHPVGGLITLALAAALWFGAYKLAKKRTHYLFIVTTAGEVPGLKAPDGDWIRRVHDAIAAALVARG